MKTLLAAEDRRKKGVRYKHFLLKESEKTNQYKVGEELKSKNGIETSEKRKNGNRKKRNGSLYLVMQERYKNDQRNREWQKTKNKQKWQRLEKIDKNGCENVGGS